MKTHAIALKFTLIALLTSLVFSSCEDDEKSPVANDPVKAEKIEKVLAFRDDLDFINRFVSDNVIDMSGDDARKSSFSETAIARLQETAPCAEATEEELPDGSLKISMDFGDGCQTDEGIEVAGKVVMTFKVNETSFEYSLEFDNYHEIGSGTIMTEIVNGSITGNFVFDLENGIFTQEMEQSLTITYDNNLEAIYHVAQKSELTETGMKVVELSTSGNFADGGAFLTTLNKTLVYDFSCEGDLPVKGEEVVIFQGNTMKVNYGTGSCDAAYTVK